MDKETKDYLDSKFLESKKREETKEEMGRKQIQAWLGTLKVIMFFLILAGIILAAMLVNMLVKTQFAGGIL